MGRLYELFEFGFTKKAKVLKMMEEKKVSMEWCKIRKFDLFSPPLSLSPNGVLGPPGKKNKYRRIVLKLGGNRSAFHKTKLVNKLL